MEQLIILIFILGYLAIALEHPLKINKTGAALFMGLLLWTIYRIGFPDHQVAEELAHHIKGIAEILFFLMGAMTIVELIDAHDGFNAITNCIRTRSPIKLLWIISAIAFFLSSLLDNLTTAIVMVSLTRKLVDDRQQRLFFAGMIIIAANAGGAWSPIGDVTTTMLWIGGQISENIIARLFLPSLICLIIPLTYVSLFEKKSLSGTLSPLPKNRLKKKNILILLLGIGGLGFVPIFKYLTHLPPYAGILLVLGLLWLVADFIHRTKDDEVRKHYSVSAALMKIDMPSILFFLGILLAVGVLESLHILEALSAAMNQALGNQSVIVMCIGLLSAIVDNVPLVAATMAMYDLTNYPPDSPLWEFIAYCAGTGGSLLIIGSAAGVAVMGIEKIDFIWYFKKISFIALLGYVAGAAVYLFMQ
jgi:NhaD family Na+/H+ antiporter